MRFEMKTTLLPEAVRERALKFFGEGGFGLKLAEKGADTLYFEGAGGSVTISTAREGNHTLVEFVEQEWETAERETVGTITIVYNHHTRELEHSLADMQHKSFHKIISTLHVHLDAHNCLEVLVVKGKSQEIKKIADRLIGTRGVKHGKLTMTTTGKELA